MLPQAWLEKKSPNTQKVMMIEKLSLPKNWRVTLKDTYKKEDKKKKQRDFNFDWNFNINLNERRRT